ncbi:hypothetical protein PFISCL1PPCAC_4955, partial [Pristionchus fissidentatus]
LDTPSRHMQYVEDIIELIEDVPDELQRRGGLIQDWERQAAEYKHEADKLTVRLNTDGNLRDDEKAIIFKKISEMLERAHDLTSKKCDMAAKCHRLVQALCERVTEYTYHCKLELEVDAPGCTTSIERNFLNETMMVAAAALNSSNAAFKPPVEKPSSRERVGSSSISRESTPMVVARSAVNIASKQRSRGSSVSSSRASSVQPFEQSAAQLQMQQRKRKQDRQRERTLQRQQSAAAAAAVPPLKDPMSAYMRKKKEREREERKLRESTFQVHANRERRERSVTSQARVIKPEPLDDGYESVPTPPPPAKPRNGPGRPPKTSRVPPIAPMVVKREEPEPIEEMEKEECYNTGMSDVDDDDLLAFLADEMPGGMADHGDLNLGLEDENLFDMASFGADLGKALEKIQKERPPSPLGQNMYGSLNAPTKSSAAGSSRYTNKNSSKADTKRQQQQQTQQRQYVSFGAGESMHGRPRKLTNRAEEMLGEMERKEKQRRLRDEEGMLGTSTSSYTKRDSRYSSVDDWSGMQEDDTDNTLYCYCQKPSDGTMVGCDGETCFYKWFHLTCLEMSSPPTVDPWYCPECRRERDRM